jgi:hypothetical protein
MSKQVDQAWKVTLLLGEFLDDYLGKAEIWIWVIQLLLSI